MAIETPDRKIVIGCLRSDLGPIDLNGLGLQNRTIQRPTPEQLMEVYAKYTYLALVGNKVMVDIDTTIYNSFSFKLGGYTSFQTVTISERDSNTPISVVINSLNHSFKENDIPLLAALNSDGHFIIKTVKPNTGVLGLIRNDDNKVSTLAEACGINSYAVSNGKDIVLKRLQYLIRYPYNDRCYPSVSHIVGEFGSFLTSDEQDVLVQQVRTLLAPELILTGEVYLSITNGQISKLASDDFKPRDLKPGAALGIFKSDGSTPLFP
jgi:hypothetical protein